MADGVRLGNIEEAFSEDLTDYIEENQYDERSAILDIDTSISEIKELRTKYQSVHKDLISHDEGTYDDMFKEGYDEKMKLVKHFLADIKQTKSIHRANENLANVKMIDNKKHLNS